jgi:hypothetical protein
VYGGVTIGRHISVRQSKECGRITCKRSGSSRVSLKSQPLIKPILSLDSAASLITALSGDLWGYGLCFITTLFLNLNEVWISGGARWSMADLSPYKGYGRPNEAGASLVGN